MEEHLTLKSFSTMPDAFNDKKTNNELANGFNLVKSSVLT
jgi:hypothetical protein